MYIPNTRRYQQGPLTWAVGSVLLVTYAAIVGVDYFTRTWEKTDPLLWGFLLCSLIVLVIGVFYLMVVRAGDRETLAVIFPGMLEPGLCPETRISVSVKVLWAMFMVNLVLVTALYLILVLAWGWDFALIRFLILGVCFIPAIYFSHRIHRLWNPPLGQFMGFE